VAATKTPREITADMTSLMRAYNVLAEYGISNGRRDLLNAQEVLHNHLVQARACEPQIAVVGVESDLGE